MTSTFLTNSFIFVINNSCEVGINDIWQANVFQMSAMAICHVCKWGRVFEKLLFLSHIIMYQITGFKFVF